MRLSPKGVRRSIHIIAVALQRGSCNAQCGRPQMKGATTSAGRYTSPCRGVFDKCKNTASEGNKAM
ncbi:hypothetical protein SCLCIDRAFT_1210501 [Scleroderma citrinum Foug A]|uniref:Uncharacterized protein n=1 Tax=Scleroderma citrinum Foug A TaxID=1036808 RepID=A0A0C3APZ7_9AGAM|nr:hypothetical protein SCLCIDRAFT_1210501 [Scleroderma citrinum Foug A]